MPYRVHLHSSRDLMFLRQHRLARREEHPEVKMVSEYHESVGRGVIHDPGVGRPSNTDRGLMNGIDALCDKKLDPSWAQIHVD